MATDPLADDLDLAELAKASGVNPRTIRYYIAQLLLPSPGTRGPGTRYDRGLIDRLQLIKLLQRDKWPLGKIRDHMRDLDDEGVRRELGEPPELPLGDSDALGYVRGVLYEKGPDYDAGSAKVDVVRPPPPVQAALIFDSPEPKPFEMRRSSWDRVRVSPHVEITFRMPLQPDQKKLVDRLLEAARQFAEEK